MLVGGVLGSFQGFRKPSRSFMGVVAPVKIAPKCKSLCLLFWECLNKLENLTALAGVVECIKEKMQLMFKWLRFCYGTTSGFFWAASKTVPTKNHTLEVRKKITSRVRISVINLHIIFIIPTSHADLGMPNVWSTPPGGDARKVQPQGEIPEEGRRKKTFSHAKLNWSKIKRTRHSH